MKQAAIWGVGGIAHIHAQALKYNNIKIAAIVDVNEKALKDFAKKWKINNYDTNPEILFASNIDTVHICTPPNLHYSMIKTLLLQGKNVICEKPLCFSEQEAKELSNLATKKNLQLIVNFNVRYYMIVQEIKKQIQNPKFGQVHLIHGSYLQAYHLLPTPFSWRYLPKLGGNMRAITEIGTHYFDLIQHLTGQKIKAVSAKFGNFNPKRQLENNTMHPLNTHISKDSKIINITSEDAALVNFELQNGAIGNVVLSEVSHGQNNHLTISITGQNGTINWDSEVNNQFTYAYNNDSLATKIEAFGDSFLETFVAIFNDFYKNEKSLIRPTMNEASNIVKICNAIFTSNAQKGKWIEVLDE